MEALTTGVPHLRSLGRHLSDRACSRLLGVSSSVNHIVCVPLLSDEPGRNVELQGASTALGPELSVSVLRGCLLSTASSRHSCTKTHVCKIYGQEVKLT